MPGKKRKSTNEDNTGTAQDKNKRRKCKIVQLVFRKFEKRQNGRYHDPATIPEGTQNLNSLRDAFNLRTKNLKLDFNFKTKDKCIFTSEENYRKWEEAVQNSTVERRQNKKKESRFPLESRIFEEEKDGFFYHYLAKQKEGNQNPRKLWEYFVARAKKLNCEFLEQGFLVRENAVCISKKDYEVWLSALNNAKKQSAPKRKKPAKIVRTYDRSFTLQEDGQYLHYPKLTPGGSTDLSEIAKLLNRMAAKEIADLPVVVFL